MNVNDITFIVLKVVVSVVTVIITGFVVPALKSYIDDRKNSQIYSLIETAVRAAEQTITGSGKGAIKKEQVVELVTKWLQERGLSISEDQLDQLIEESVYLMKNS